MLTDLHLHDPNDRCKKVTRHALATPTPTSCLYPANPSGVLGMAGGRLAVGWLSTFLSIGGGGPSERAFWYGAITNKIFFKMKNAYRTQPKGTKIMDMYYHNIAFEPRMVAATEARLEAIYKAAKAGLKGDALAMAAGLLPVELRKLQQFDPTAEFAELKGRADSELEAAAVIDQAIAHGDAKMALEKLKHQHGWVAKQQISVDVEQRISITQALEQANQRVLEVVDAEYSVLTAPNQEANNG